MGDKQTKIPKDRRGSFARRAILAEDVSNSPLTSGLRHANEQHNAVAETFILDKE